MSSKMPRRIVEAVLIVAVAIGIGVVLWPRRPVPNDGVAVSATPLATIAATPQPPSAPSANSPTSTERASELPSPTPTALPTIRPTLPTPQPTGYAVGIAAGLNPTWNPAAAAAAASSRIAIMEQLVGHRVRPAQIISVEAMRGVDVPAAISGPFEELQVAWVVHAYGTFVNAHGPTQAVFDEGWYVFNEDGRSVGAAFEHPVESLAPPG